MLARDGYKAYASCCKDNGSYATNSRRFLAGKPDANKLVAQHCPAFRQVGIPLLKLGKEAVPEEWVDERLGEMETRKATPSRKVI